MSPKILVTFIAGITISSSSAVSLSLTGNIFPALQDASGTNLPDGSLVQVGFFQGIAVTTDPSTFTSSEWDTFTPLAGGGLTFAENLGITTSNVFGDFPSAVILQNVVTDPNSNLFDGAFTPVRIGFRIFDSLTDVTSSDFNTVTCAEIALNSVGDTGFFWEDAANPFQTSISVIPEPSSMLSLTLGLGLLLGTRRRK